MTARPGTGRCMALLCVWVLAVGVWMSPAGVTAARAESPQSASQPASAQLDNVEIYVNIDEMAALWKFRDDKTGVLPAEGTPEREAYREKWMALSAEVLAEARKRIPRQYKVVPAAGKELHAPLRLGVFLADIQTSCNAPTYYKYLWVRIWQEGDAFATNWDGLGARSETVADTRSPADKLLRDGLRSWTEVWGQVPYLRVRDRTEKTPASPEVSAPPATPGG
ncbi:MAG: hypothetical protein OEW11_00555 [Nitrospirota bacterium]|nr:hypothetical protein [Nitrospirota bacterium]